MEMEKHDDGWPFLQPVNCKQFTSYRKFIKTPMDFSTMKQKLRDERYSTNTNSHCVSYHLCTQGEVTRKFNIFD